MQFELLPLLEKMQALYQLPRNRDRFKHYLQMLQGDTKDDMILPIAAYNPMGKDAAVEKLGQLLQLDAEAIAAEEIKEINAACPSFEGRTVSVGLNLIDDLEGAWSNYYATDYKSRFEIGPFVNRNFCTPCFWTSETITEDLIRRRVRAYVFRTKYWVEHPAPTTLSDFFEQEVYVQERVNSQEIIPPDFDLEATAVFFQTHQATTEYNLIFNFFYGDAAAEQLAYPSYGVESLAGLYYAAYLAEKRKSEGQ